MDQRWPIGIEHSCLRRRSRQRRGGGAHYEMMLKSMTAGAATDFEPRLKDAEGRMGFWGLRQPPPDERLETSRSATFLITQFRYDRRYFLEGPADQREGAPTVRAEISKEELDAIRKLPEKIDRAKAIGDYVNTRGSVEPP